MSVVDCDRCGGTGTFVDVNGSRWRCAYCKGTGRLVKPDDEARTPVYPTRACPTCGRVVGINGLRRHLDTHREPRLRLLVSLDVQDKIIRLYNRPGGTKANVAAQVHWSPETIANVLRANGVPLRRHGGRTGHRLMPVEEELKRAELYGQGLTVREVAAECGVTYKAVYVSLLRSGVKLRKRGPRPRNLRRSEASALARDASSPPMPASS